MDITAGPGDRVLSAWRPPPAVATALAYAAGSTLVVAAVALGAAADTTVPLVNGLLRGAIVAAPLAAAAYAFREPGYARFGRLLLAVGLVSFLSTLSDLPDPAAYTAGRFAGWGVEALVVLLVLAFPTGRFETRLDRRLATGMVGVVAFLVLTTGLAGPFPVPSPWTSCVEDCPPNELAVLHEPSLGFNPLIVTSVALFVVLLAVVVRIQQRCEEATGLRRQMLLPLLLVSMVRTALVGCGFAWRLVDPGSPVVETCSWLIALATPLVSVAFLVGLVRMRLFTEGAVVHLARHASRPLDAHALQREFATAFADPAIQVVFPSEREPGGWMDADAKPVCRERDPSRRLHVVHDGTGRPLAGLVCDPALAEHPGLLDAGSSIASVALENVRLQADAASAGRELRRSRARIAAAADHERRRIERDLHDGAQQRLVALRIELGLVEELIEQDPARGVARVRELEENVDAALEELRALAHGVRPPLLDHRGLAEALPAVAAGSPLHVEVRLSGVARYPPEVESAVYFCVLEALQNAAKHARGATRVDLAVEGCLRRLRFWVRDDGDGVPGGRPTAGAGLTNMQDRLAAVGGELTFSSDAGRGATVAGDIPLTP